jgi:hypothetical protein
MDFSDIWKTVSKNALRLTQQLEAYIELINWAYVGFSVFGVLFVWMVIDSVIGTQISPLFLLAVGMFFVLFYLFTKMIGEML